MTGNRSGAFATDTDAQGILTLTLDLPGEKVNTLGSRMIEEFDALLDDVEKDDAIRGVVIRSGKPDNFIAGADIKEFTQISTAEEGEALSRSGHAILGKLAARRHLE